MKNFLARLFPAGSTIAPVTKINSPSSPALRKSVAAAPAPAPEAPAPIKTTRRSTSWHTAPEPSVSPSLSEHLLAIHRAHAHELYLESVEDGSYYEKLTQVKKFHSF